MSQTNEITDTIKLIQEMISTNGFIEANDGTELNISYKIKQ